MKKQVYICLGIIAILNTIGFVISLIIKSVGIFGGTLITFIMLFGVLCFLSDKPKHKSKQKLRQKSEKEMSGLEYEHWCAKEMARSGQYRKVTVTPPTGDFGADIVAVDGARRKWVFQCKHYKSRLGNTPIQEVVGAKAHYKADCAAVVTNSTFTPKAKQLARENNVMLYEGITEKWPRQKHRKQWNNYSVEEMIFYDDIFD